MSEVSSVEDLAVRLAAALGGSVATGAAQGGAGPPGEGPGDGIGCGGYGPQVGFPGDDATLRSGMTPLLEYGLLKVHGADAASFLQAQLTNDVATLGDGEVRLAGYCSVKGRLLASFWVWRDTARQAFWLACSRDIATALARRLSMFVLRAKAKVENVSDSVALLGIVNLDGDVAGLPAQGGRGDAVLELAPVELPPVVISAALAASLDPARLETAGEVVVARALQPIAAASLEAALQRLQANGTTLLSTPLWRRLEVLSGIARINASNQELFVPQMVNFELVGGVSFRKGCYPGQEIVARSQYLGKLKRRMFLGLGAGAAPEPGADVHAPGAAAAEPVGQVVLAAPAGDGKRFVVLFESVTTAVPASGDAGEGALQIGTSPVSRFPLPYPMPPAAPATASTPRMVSGTAAGTAAGTAPGVAAGTASISTAGTPSISNSTPPDAAA